MVVISRFKQSNLSIFQVVDKAGIKGLQEMSLLKHSAPTAETYAPVKSANSFSVTEEMIVPDRIIVFDGNIAQTGDTEEVSANCDSNEVFAPQVLSEESANTDRESSRSASVLDVSNSGQAKVHATSARDADSTILPPKRVNIRYLPKIPPEDDEDLNPTEQYEALMNIVQTQEDRLAKMEAQLTECLWLLRSGCALFLIGFISVIVSKCRRRL